MKRKKELSVHDKAVRLCEGGVVECGGHFIRAVKLPYDVDSCAQCNMDSACGYYMSSLCYECDDYEGGAHILMFAYE